MVRIVNRSSSFVWYVGLFLAYILVGHLLTNVSFQSQVVPIWLPAGIALVGCYIFGWRFLPAVFLASFVFNYSVQYEGDESVLFGSLLFDQGLGFAVIAFGASLQALVGSTLLRCWLGDPLRQPSSIKILYFIFVVGILVNLISASIGTYSLSVFNPDYSEEHFWNNILYWWLGDSLGVLLATPFILSLVSVSMLDIQQQRSRFLVLASTSILFIAITVLTAFFIDFSTDSFNTSTAKEAKNIENSLYRELNHSISQLQTLASYIKNTKKLEREEFNYFVNNLIYEQPTIAAMSWNRVISQQEKDKHQLMLKDIYDEDIAIRGESILKDDPIVYVQFIAPEIKNKKAIGFNVFSKADRKKSLIDAKLDFQSKATPIISLVQSEKYKPAYLLFFPVFKENREIEGYATGVFLAEDMVVNAFGASGLEHFDYEIYEANSRESFSSNTQEDRLFSDKDAKHLMFNLAGQTWNLFLVANKEYLSQQKSQSYLILYFLEFVIITFIILLILMMHSRQIQLNTIVDEKTNSLKYAVREANHANSAKTRFLANMSHEIRTPMNAVIGFSTLARQSDNMEEIKEYLDKINISSNLLLNIVNDILDISKIEADKLSLFNEPFDMNISFDRINSVFQSQVEAKGLSWALINNIPSSLFFNGDQTRFEQVLVNLCSNAFKFTQSGGIELRVDVEILSPQKNQVTVRVKDTGIGITKESQEKIFNVFTQADESTSRKFGGTGLGLALSKELSQLMQGDISINSNEGRGAEFVFQSIIETAKDYTPSKNCRNDSTISAEAIDHGFESESESESESALVIQKNTREVKNLRVLVAEDNEINQLVIEAILEKLGISPVLVTNGEEAVAQIQQQDFDVVLMDCQMPILDGYKATQQIRQLAGYEEMPIFALTADVTAEGKKKAKASGFTGHLSKPILVEKLLEKLESI